MDLVRGREKEKMTGSRGGKRKETLIQDVIYERRMNKNREERHDIMKMVK